MLGAGTLPGAVCPIARPADAAAHRAATQRTTWRGPRSRVDVADRAERHGVHAGPVVDGAVPAADSLRAGVGLRAADEGSGWPEVGLRPAQSDAANGVYGDWFFEAASDGFQSVIPASSRGAARIRFFSILRQNHPVRQPSGGSF